MSVTVRDLFCGAGGSSLGAELAGVELKHALNHWERAIETHQRNFPNADHSCADISSLTTAQIRRFEPTDILWASPECTNHSLAKGGRRRKPQAGSLFDDGPAGDAEQDRSRATMWDVVRFAEQAHLHGTPYKAIIVENVVDAVRWGYDDDGGLFNAWLLALRALGYEHECVFLNSMMCWPTPQSRDRVYVVFWLKGMRRPDLDVRPQCWCPTCQTIVPGVQTWKRPQGDKGLGRVWGRYGQQYFYTCADCHNPVLPAVYPAASIIDYAQDAQRIGDRDKPLAENTRERIRRGLERLASDPFAIRLQHGICPKPLTLPLVTLTRRQDMAMVFPVAGNTFERTPGNRARNGDLVPLDTVHTTLDRAMAIVPLRKHGEAAAATEQPVHTFTAGGFHHAVLMRNNLDASQAAMLTPDSEPARTLTTHGHQSVVIPYYRTGRAQPDAYPTPTLTSHDRLALAVPGLTRDEDRAEPMPITDSQIDDCLFRMFTLPEIQSAMAMNHHADGGNYDVTGNKRERMAQLGNAVTPPAARELVSRVIDIL
jgi:DNA (cytosine-5)-methyltransferase 1